MAEENSSLSGSARLLLIYDGWCGVCTRTAEWVCEHDRNGRVTALPNQLPGLLDDIGLTRAQVNRAAWALERSGVALEGAAAISRVLVELPRWAWVGRLYGVPAIAMVGDLFYRWFARRRGDFARWGSVPTCERRGVACTPEGVD